MQKIAYGLVRDANGCPKFDDPENVPQPVVDALTDEDWSKLKRLRPEIYQRLPKRK